MIVFRKTLVSRIEHLGQIYERRGPDEWFIESDRDGLVPCQSEELEKVYRSVSYDG